MQFLKTSNTIKQGSSGFAKTGRIRISAGALEYNNAIDDPVTEKIDGILKGYQIRHFHLFKTELKQSLMFFVRQGNLANTVLYE